jgi:hypothetical protein
VENVKFNTVFPAKRKQYFDYTGSNLAKVTGSGIFLPEIIFGLL